MSLHNWTGRWTSSMFRQRRRWRLEQGVSTAEAEQSWSSWNSQEFSLGPGVRWSAESPPPPRWSVLSSLWGPLEGVPAFLRFGVSNKFLGLFVLMWCAFNILMSCSPNSLWQIYRVTSFLLSGKVIYQSVLHEWHWTDGAFHMTTQGQSQPSSSKWSQMILVKWSLSWQGAIWRTTALHNVEQLR